MRYFLGIDGGATKTHTLLVDQDGQHHGEGSSGPSNYHIVGVEQAAANLAASISAAGTSTSDAEITAVCAGLAGFDGPSDAESVRRVLTGGLRSVRVNCPWQATNDSVVAWAGAFEGQPGALIAAGSGAVAFAVGPDGRSARSDGLGHWLGDAGSGFAVGRSGLRAALAALDKRGPATSLTDSFLATAGRNPDEWVRWVAELDTGIAFAHLQLRSFAPAVVQDAYAGDDVAVSILKEAGKDLADTAASVVRKVGLVCPQVATAGSLFAHSQLLRQAFQQALLEQLPNCTVSAAVAGPASGAALLARKPDMVPSDALQVADS